MAGARVTRTVSAPPCRAAALFPSVIPACAVEAAQRNSAHALITALSTARHKINSHSGGPPPPPEQEMALSGFLTTVTRRTNNTSREASTEGNLNDKSLPFCKSPSSSVFNITIKLFYYRPQNVLSAKFMSWG